MTRFTQRAALLQRAAMLIFITLPVVARAQNPLRHWTEAVDARFSVHQPVIGYTLRVDSANLDGFDVIMAVRAARDTVLLGMGAHPEYDDRYWRYIRDVRVEATGGRATVTAVDSALWRVIAPGGVFVLHYRLALPAADRPFLLAWQPFLSPTGGLVGGIHSFMYVVGQTLAPSHVTLDLPASWSVSTALVPTSNPRTFYAPSVAALTESPMLVGRLRDWRFAVDGVPHRVTYWPLPDATPFDTAALTTGIERLVRGAVALFGRAPYREYVFQIRDGAVGALEHPSSVTLGAPSRSLAEGVAPLLEEVAHEYFHAWNLMRIRPAEAADVTYRTPPRSRGLWFSEGLTMFYADLLRRRADIPVDEPTRRAHLEALMGRYFASPGNARFSPERVSEAEYGGAPDALGDYTANTHLQGELIGALLDFRIRHATNGRRSMDDVMRLMLERHAGNRGFTSRDVERAVSDVCRCSAAEFFARHVRGAEPLPFDDYLRFIGARAEVTWRPALGGDGRPVADLRAYPYDAADGSGPRLKLTIPESAWGRAGLHTGDRIIAVNGTPARSADSVRFALRRLASGDTVSVEVERRGMRHIARVVMAPFDRPFVEIRDLPTATPAERALRDRWESGAP